jgi:hypothetical protein
MDHPTGEPRDRSDAGYRRLTKGRFLALLQCVRRLWWEHHEPDAPELVPDAALEARFERGRRVGALARERFRDGVLIEVPHTDPSGRVRATREALGAGTTAVFEASFEADGEFAAIDVLLREPDGFRVIEVKMSTSVKDEHLPDIAFQVQLAERAGLTVTGAEVMHLNRRCRHPDVSNLFTRDEVTREVREMANSIDAARRLAREVVDGPLPEVVPSTHCGKPFDCPFRSRCWAAMPEHHLYTLYRARQDEIDALLASGIDTVGSIPPGAQAGSIRERQVAAVRSGAIQVKPGLANAMRAVRYPAVHLDFETVWPPIPPWPGMRPYDHAVVQVSAHREHADGKVDHGEWLADGPDDPRRAAAEFVLHATEDAACVVAYNATFERKRIEELGDLFPDLRTQLRDVCRRLVDPLPIVREHVYHPDFLGSFGLKAVLPVLVPGEHYAGLDIAEGSAASIALERMLLDGDALAPDQKARLREDLLRYCRMDTWAMVLLCRRLRELKPTG